MRAQEAAAAGDKDAHRPRVASAHDENGGHET
jgi:hypothetical protein